MRSCRFILHVANTLQQSDLYCSNTSHMYVYLILLTTSDPTELVERANRMQKEMRHTHGTTKSSNTTRKRKHESSGTGTTVFTSVSSAIL